VADERNEREQREEEAEAALASAGAAGASAAGEHEDAPGEPQPEDGAPVEGEVPAGEEAEAATAALDDPAPQDDKAAQYLALAQRTQADFENFRRRATRERGEAEARGVGRLARELLPALDNLERALVATEAQDTEFTKGVRLVQGELAAALGRSGIEAYSPKGEPFDPNVHEAMAQHPVEGVASGTVIEVYQPGYRLADTVLRPARVVVAA